MRALDRRRSGVLLHLSSLPGAAGQAGQGVLTDPARRFVDLLADSGFTVWQILPIGPTGDDRSPYASSSVHAGNPEFIDRSDTFDAQRDGSEFHAFVEAQSYWLHDEALFFTLKAQQQGQPWYRWAPPLRDRDPQALEIARRDYCAQIEEFQRDQYLFQRQWRTLREYAQARGVRLFGDLPLYPAHDSAEVWAHRRDFQLDADGMPLAVAGVPPDYFSADGQLWGNPLYDWREQQSHNFPSWIARLRSQLKYFDLLRIDHFRGLSACWEVPFGASTARDGQWRPVPGAALLSALQSEFGDLPLVAEDLGVITQDVIVLRDGFGLPGMRVLQFAFGRNADNPHLPHNLIHNSVVYTGTHDNDTTLGWYQKLDVEAQRHAQAYLHAGPVDFPEALVCAALEAVSDLAVVPLQDLLGLDSTARMNVPGTVGDNWRWSFVWEQIPADFAERWRRENQLYGR
jgi:4-alpha-glucanotransferase